MDSATAGERYVREGIALRVKALPEGHWLLASADAALGEVFSLAGRHSEAERLLLSAESRLLANRGEGSGALNDVRKKLVALYTAWKKPADATKWQARVDKKRA